MADRPQPRYEGEDPYVFVSYAHEDDDLVFPEIRWLQGQGFNVWYDEGIKPGLEWRAALSESIKAAHLVVFFITPRSVQSDHCLREIDLAVDLKKPLLAVYLEPTQLPSGTDLTLSRIQGILRYQLTEPNYQKALVRSVGEHIERGVARVAGRPGLARVRRNTILYLGGAALVIASFVSVSLIYNDSPNEAPPAVTGALTKFTLSVPERYLPPFGQPDIAVSPDGDTLVYNAGGMLHARRMDAFDSTPLRGTRDAHGPFFSPDGRWIGFTQDQSLRKYSVKTGVITDVAPRIGPNFSGHWGEDDTIVFSPIGNVGISRVGAGGGEPEVITRLDEQSLESTHMWPQLLPGNSAVMYTALGPSAGWEEAQIVVQDLESGQRKVLVRNASQAAYVAPHRVVYVNGGGNLMIAPFDPDRQRLTGPAVPIQSGILRSIWGAGASYAASPGTLAFVQGDAFKGMRIERILRDGEVSRFGEPTYGNYLRIAPDDARMALTIRGANNDDIYTFNLATGEHQRLTFELAEDETPVWSADGSQIAYVSAWKGNSRRVFVKPADGSGEAQLLHTDPRHLHTNDWSRDGRWLLFDQLPLYDVFAIDIETGEEVPIAVSSALENEPQFSPDGSWVAFASDESGRGEIYVVSFPDARVKHQVSRRGGISPRWADNNELFYWAGPDLVSALVSINGGFVVERREIVHTDPAMTRMSMTSIPGYDVTSDGREIYVIKEQDELAPTRIHVIREWQSELNSRAATD